MDDWNRVIGKTIASVTELTPDDTAEGEDAYCMVVLLNFTDGTVARLNVERSCPISMTT